MLISKYTVEGPYDAWMRKRALADNRSLKKLIKQKRAKIKLEEDGRNKELCALE